MRTQKLWAVILPGILAVRSFSCSKDDGFGTACRLNKVVQGENTTTLQAYYNSDQRIERLVTYDASTQVVDLDYRMYRNGDGKIDSVYVYNGSQEVAGKYKMLYNLEGKVGQVDVLTDANDDGTFEVTEHYEVIYSASNVSEVRKFNASNIQTATYGFTWLNGNVISFDNDGSDIALEFDDKFNLYTGVGTDLFFLNPQLLPLIMSKNNATQIVTYDALGQLDLTVDISYQYNDEGLPEQSTSVVNGNATENHYTYDCS